MMTQPLLDMLAGIEKVFAELDIDFYLVGAVARDIQFSLKDENIRARATEDVDIAVMVSDQAQYTAIKNELIAAIFIAKVFSPMLTAIKVLSSRTFVYLLNHEQNN
jgi:predicted nucleotidyltransferase